MGRQNHEGLVVGKCALSKKKKSCFRSNFLECYGVGFVGALFPLPDEALFARCRPIRVFTRTPLCSESLCGIYLMGKGFSLCLLSAGASVCFHQCFFLLISLGFYLFCLLHDFAARHPYPCKQVRVKEINNSKANTHKKERVLSRSLVPLAKLLWYLRELHADVLTGY